MTLWHWLLIGYVLWVIGSALDRIETNTRNTQRRDCWDD